MTKIFLDRYRLIAQLGRGGMAEVYLAVSQGTHGFTKLFVLKVLDPQLARDETFLSMFRDEARLAARLNHSNLVQTYEVGESDGRNYIAMEYLDGQPLSLVLHRLSANGGWPMGAALRIAIDALGGLDHAHDLRGFDGTFLGIVHRDITPQNLLITYEGQVKIVDFGIAKALDSSTQTKVGTLKGKVAYMAPEQARGETVDGRADLFSVAAILWEMLAGRRMWAGLTDVALIARLVAGEIPDLAAICPSMDPRLSGLVMQGLSPDPGSRPATAREFQRQLEEVASELGLVFGQRALGALVSEPFVAERTRVQAVIKKQLERVARDTPSGETPPHGWKLPPSLAGSMPILGEGSSVHDEVTTLHTGPTGVSALGLGAAARTDSSDLRGPGVALRGRTRSAVGRNLMVGAAGALVFTLATVLLVLPNWPKGRAVSSKAKAEVRESGRPASVAGAGAGMAAPSPGCDSTNKPLIELSGEITEDGLLTCDKDYLLKFTTYVTPGATLTIQPGTVLLGDGATKGTLVVQPGGRIVAQGTSARPIVFTSAQPLGKRRPGDWGGVVILGQAPVNLRDASGKLAPGKVEGLTSGGAYGGTSPADSSGVLSYVRIEYSGTELAPNNEINGLTLAGVGRGTQLDHVQVRFPADDCFEFFGGTVDGKYLACQSVDDDAFDWDFGYTGRLQFLVSQASPELGDGSNGLEGDSDPNGTRNSPVSAPMIYNATLCGKGRPMGEKEHYAVLLRRGTQGRLRNILATGFSAGLDVRDAETKPNIAGSIFFNNLTHNLGYPEVSTARKSEKLTYDDDAGFDEARYLANPGLHIGEADPGLGNCSQMQGDHLKPRHALLAGAAQPPNDGFFEVGAAYVGAFRDQTDTWDHGGWLVWGEQ